MSDSVGQYLNEIGLVPLLTALEERELSQIIEKGRDAQAALDAGERGRELQRAVRAAANAKDRFIRANLRLVVSVARRYPLPPGMELLDLIQEGNLGLEHAVDKFDWRKGFKFSTYATFWIRQAIGRALDQKASLVRLPGDRSASLRAALRQVSGDGDELDDEHARLHRLTTPTSLDRTIGDDDSNELIDLLADANPGPEAQVMSREDDRMITDLLVGARQPGPPGRRAALRPAGRSQAQLPRGRRGARRHRRSRSPPGEAGGHRRPRAGRRAHRRRLIRTPFRHDAPASPSGASSRPGPHPGRRAPGNSPARPAPRGRILDGRQRRRRCGFAPTAPERPPFSRDFDLDAHLVAGPHGCPAARLARPRRPRSRHQGPVHLSPAGVRRRGPRPHRLAGPGRQRRGLPAPGRRLRRVVRRLLGRRHPQQAPGHPADGGRAHVLVRRPGREGRAHRRSVRQAPLVRHRDRRRRRAARRSAATSSTTSPSPPRPASPTPSGSLTAYNQSAATLNLVRAFTKGGFADLSRVHSWTQEFVASSNEGRRYEQVADEIDRALRFMKACGDAHQRAPPAPHRSTSSPATRP